MSVDTFVAGDVIDVTGVSKGKGFQGAIKRHGQSRGPMSHGSHFHRAPGLWVLAPDSSRLLKAKKCQDVWVEHCNCSKLRSSSS